MTAGQDGYVSHNRFVTLALDGTTITEEASDDDDTVESVTGTINSHMVHLSQQTMATLKANANQINASLQQLASNNEQLHQQQQALMQQIWQCSPPMPMSQGPELQLEQELTTPLRSLQSPAPQPRFMPHPRF